MEIIRPQPKTYRTRRKKKQPAKSYRVVSQEVAFGETVERVDFVFKLAPWIMGPILFATVFAGYILIRKQIIASRIADEACINQMMWVQPDEGWDTPKVDEDLLRLCYEREKVF